MDHTSASRGWRFDVSVELYQECVAWPLDYVMVEVVEEECRMRIRAGVLGSPPI
ncbi:hypothetical protein X771_11585 [Mesorhizobium sp. LSJC277A00]|nr:hypothetical protein X771_11585 [Mesorhizobium sp. LSJC277A00]